MLSTALMMASTLAVLIGAPVAATSGRDSPATAMDANSGPFLGLTGPGTPFVNPNPLAEDWYKVNVVPGQMLQVGLLSLAGNRVTLYHPDGCTATTCPNEIGWSQAGDNCFGYGFADFDLFITKAETIYIKVSPAANPTGNQPYNLAIRAYNLTEITSGGSYTPPVANTSIHGIGFPWVLGGTCQNGQGTLFIPMQFTTDYYWVNVSDSASANHQNFRVSATWTCATAIYDLLLYQINDWNTYDLTLLNHSLAYQRREDRGALTTVFPQFDFAPVLYDGRYLLQVTAQDNGSFSRGTADRYNYQVSVSSAGGYAKDGNDRRDEGPWVNTSVKVTGRIDGRDDSGDWFRFSLNKGDSATMSVNLFRENGEINTWGQRYRAMVFTPNGTMIEDHFNWGYSGNTPYFNPYLTIPSFTAPDNGTFYLLLQTADGGLNYRVNNNQPQLTGYTGRNWADYEVNFVLPNRRPEQLVDPIPTLSMSEDGTATINLGTLFRDPEQKFGYPTFGFGSSPNFTFSVDATGRNLTAAPKPDFCGNDFITFTVRDDVPANTYAVTLNLTVACVNDAPRTYVGAGANWSSVNVPEDAETTVPLRSIFYDVDDIDLNFTVGGVSGGHLGVLINDISKIVTITPQPNWNGCQDLTWTARDPSTSRTDFTTNVCVTPLNDPPRATDRHLDRIVFNEGGEATVDLSGEFFDLDLGDNLYYYGVIDDPLVAQYVRINNSLLDPKDPYMRVYVIDSARAEYFTDGPVQVRFMVFDRPMGDPAANYDPATGQQLQVEKTTFLEVLNVNDPPILDEYTPTPEEVALPATPWTEGDTITFSVTDMKDPDHEQQFFYKWFVNDNEVPQEVSPTFVFRTVLDQTRPGQYAAGSYTVRVQVFDASQSKAIVEPTWSFDVHKTNRKPTVTILRPTNPTFEEGTQVQFQALATDEDPEDAANLEQNITWSYTDASGITHTFGAGDHAERYLDPGTYEVTVSAFDGSEYSNSTITLTITEHRLNTPGFESAGAAIGMLAAAAAVALQRRRRS